MVWNKAAAYFSSHPGLTTWAVSSSRVMAQHIMVSARAKNVELRFSPGTSTHDSWCAMMRLSMLMVTVTLTRGLILHTRIYTLPVFILGVWSRPTRSWKWNEIEATSIQSPRTTFQLHVQKITKSSFYIAPLLSIPAEMIDYYALGASAHTLPNLQDTMTSKVSLNWVIDQMGGEPPLN